MHIFMCIPPPLHPLLTFHRRAQFRIPPPGAKVDGKGMLTANVEFPGMTIEYAVTSGDRRRAEPSFQTYTAPVTVPVGSNVLVRSSFNGRSSRVEELDSMWKICYAPWVCCGM